MGGGEVRIIEGIRAAGRGFHRRRDVVPPIAGVRAPVSSPALRARRWVWKGRRGRRQLSGVLVCLSVRGDGGPDHPQGARILCQENGSTWRLKGCC